MFITANGRSINIHAPYVHGTIRYRNLLDAALRTRVGVIEIADPVPPADYSPATYFRTEQPTAPYVVFTKKSAEVLAVSAKSKVQAEIDATEGAAYMPRIVRESVLKQKEKDAIAEGTDLTQDKGYVKLKALDDQVAALRAQLTN